MRAISATFRHPVRYAPQTANRLDSFRVEHPDFCAGVKGEDSYRVGTIDVFLKEGPEGERYCRIWNPNSDRLNGGGPMVTYVPMEAVASWEPMSEDKLREFYPHEFPAPKVKHHSASLA